MHTNGLPARGSADLSSSFAGYQLLERLGVGGMAEVWRARQDAYGASKVIAIKLIAPDLTASLRHRRMFLKEARLSMMLSHSNIVQVFAVGMEQTRCYMAMEWVDGLNLAQLMRRCEERQTLLPFSVVGFLIAELLSALVYAHAIGDGDTTHCIIHRDISPHNVLTSVSGEVKLGDFGIARIASEDSTGLHIQGKLRYMAPEQAAGETREPTVDLYAVGALLHELIEGRRFRSDVPRPALFAKVISGEMPPLRRQQVPPPLATLCEALLVPDPRARIPDARTALDRLGPWASQPGARLELADLVRRFSGVQGPRSGLGIRSEVVEESPPGDIETGVASSPSIPEVGADTRVTTRSEGPSTVVARRRSRQPQLWRALTLSCMGVGVGVGVALLAPSWPSLSKLAAVDDTFVNGEFVASPALGRLWTADTFHDPPNLNDPARSITNQSDAPIPAAAPAAAPDAGDTGALAGEDDITVASPGPSPAHGPIRRSRAAPAPASVRFAVHEFHYLDLRVGGKVWSLDPTSTLSLPPGRHRVEIRQGSAGPWIVAGTIELAPGGHYQVNFKLPGVAELRRR